LEVFFFFVEQVPSNEEAFGIHNNSTDGNQQCVKPITY